MKFSLYTSNKLEVLADLFVDVICNDAPEDPMCPETTVIQTQGMALWLNRHIASKTGIAANIENPFLNNYVEQIILGAFPDIKFNTSEISTSVMTWRIYRILAHNAESYPELASYLHGNKIYLRRFQLAARIAEAFDQYQIFRPEYLDEWRKSPGKILSDQSEDWQKRLFLELSDGVLFRDELITRFCTSSVFPPDISGRRVSVFGVGTLPPLYLQFFRKLSEIKDVHFFYLNPCEEYWEYQYSNREKKSLSRKYRQDWETFAADGNPLLASFGAQGREFFSEIMKLPELILSDESKCFAPYVTVSADDKLVYTEYTRLSAVQQDILTMIARGESLSDGEYAENAPVIDADPEDDSITIHNCHSPLREMEVLHDQLIRLLSDGRIQPRDIIVMAPDIVTYVPYINAVFGNGDLRNSYSISDRAVRDTSLVVNAFMDIISMHKSRFEASRVLDLFNIAAIRSKFGVDDARFQRIRRWVIGTKIRWGIDGKARAESGSASFDEFSWLAGIKRMILGFALIQENEFDDNVISDILPYDDIEGDDAGALGSFVQFLEGIFELRHKLAMKRTVAEWGELLFRTIDTFFASDNESYVELTALRASIENLVRDSAAAGLDCPVEIDVISENINVALQVDSGSRSFMRGKISFCSMVPMRSIPSKVIALVGLNDGAFPRRDIKSGFNLIRNKVKVCDKSRRSEDRYLFLEAILSAREKLMFFYQGQTAKGDQEFPPAVPLAEIVDYLKQAFSDKGSNAVFKHKLQAFDFDYFKRGSRLFSYSENNYKAASALAGMLNGRVSSGRNKWSDFQNVLPEIQLTEAVDLYDLENFLYNPAAFYLKKNAGTKSYNKDADVVLDEEMFSADGLDTYSLKNLIGRWTLAEIPVEKQYEKLKLESSLPVGTIGEITFNSIYNSIVNMKPVLRESLSQRQKVDISATVGGVTISGKADVLADGLTQFLYRYSSLKSRDAISFYLRHLVLCIMNGDSGGVSSVTNLKQEFDESITLLPLAREEAEARLSELLDIYRRGQTSVLPLFPAASFEYARHEKSNEAKLNAAKKMFVNGNTYAYIPADLEDNSVGMLFSEDSWNEPAFVDEFSQLAEIVYTPFFVANGALKYGMIEERTLE